MKNVIPHTASDFTVPKEETVTTRKFRTLSKEEFEKAVNAPFEKFEATMKDSFYRRLGLTQSHKKPGLRF